ncbi:hypothetical protein HOA55_02960 [archaeon]|jgi:hypothetical protein|nr:hypothetical protein [archaeon]MBT3577467.1 hypothetical protein [archaeon]MBT6820290.1 hypothetical protein [archaeon]MBT6955987.1 hypothetical protein [archaeon]MBT7025104.1 hypothetical protein [archaeon]
MIERKVQSKKRYVLAFIIGTAIFILGFAITNTLAYMEFQRISGLQDPISYKIFQDKLQFSLFNKDICKEDSYLKISEDLGFQGRIIDDLERKFGKNDEKVLFRKRFYSLIELEHFEFVKLLNQECDTEINTILFFYSNEEKDSEEAVEIGRILGVVHQRNRNLTIYSFDMNLDSEIVKSLMEKHEIAGEMAIVVNEGSKIVSPRNIAQIESGLVAE